MGPSWKILQSLHLQTLTLIASARGLFVTEGDIFMGPGLGTWASLGAVILPAILYPHQGGHESPSSCPSLSVRALAVFSLQSFEADFGAHAQLPPQAVCPPLL